MPKNFCENINDILRKSALFIVVLLTTILLFTSILFIVKIPITIFHLPISFIIAIIVFFIFNKDKENIKSNIISIIISILIIIIISIISSFYYDHTFDGNTYHKDAVGTLKSGFNPLYDNYTEFYKETNLKNPEIVHNVWFKYYAKGIYMVSASFYKVYGNIEAAKVFNLLISYVAFCLVFSIMYKKTNSNFKAFLLAVLASITPITLAQYFTYYNDGALYSALLSLIIVLIAFINPKETIDKKELYLWLVSLIIINVNIKFTSFAYAGIFAAGLYLIYVHQNFKNRTLKEIIKPTIVLASSVIIAVIIVGASTYITNTINNGNPFYPLVGKGKVDIMSSQQPYQFEGKSKLYKLGYSLFSKTDNATAAFKRDLELKIPFIIKDSDWYLQAPDIRVSGFGVWFSGIFIISVTICIIGLIKSYKKDIFIYKTTGVVLLITTVLILALGESWWARYVPFMYFYPLIALLYLFIIFENKLLNKIIITVFIVILMINMGFFLVFNTAYNFYNSLKTRESLKELKNNDTTITFVNDNFSWGILYNFDDFKIKYDFSEYYDESDIELYFRKYRINK